MANGDPYTQVFLANFGKGLNLRDKVDSVDPAEAIDALNVEFTQRGAVAQRAGFGKFTSAALTNRVDSLSPFYKSDGTRQLLAGAGTRLEALNTSGGVVASATGLNNGPYTFARFGSPGTETAYAGNGTDTLRKWDGSAWTAPTGTVNGTASSALPKAGIVALMPDGNRLVATGFATTTGGPGGTTSSPSHVFFSNPGLPETWETDGDATTGRGRNLVQLTPGDGEKIMAAVAWRELVFVFKETKFFVFFSTTTNSQDGTPRFNFRPVSTGQGLASPRAIAVGRDGVYFMSRRGVYRTTGGEPQLISSLIDPIWLGDPSSYFSSPTLNHSAITASAMAWHNERLFVSYPGQPAAAANRTLVYDTQLGWWTIYDLPAAAMVSFRVADAEDLMFAYASGTNDVGRHGSAAQFTNDAGVAISSWWQSNWSAYTSTPVKTIRESLVSGTGRLSAQVLHDYLALGSSSTLTFDQQLLWGSGLGGDWLWGSGALGDVLWGSGFQVATKLSRKAVRGAVFSVRLSNNVLNRTWSVERIVHNIRESRIPTIPAAT